MNNTTNNNTSTSNWDSAYNYGMAALGSISDSLSAYSAAATASGNKKIARENKARMNRAYEAAITETETNKAINLASNRMDFILSGFQVNKEAVDTPSLVQDLTLKVYDKDIDMLRLNQETENRIYDQQIKMFKKQEKKAKDQALFSDIMGVVQTVAMIAMLI